MANTYLKMTGASDLPLTQFPWQADPILETLVRFPRDQFPSGLIGPGDTLVLYAVGGWSSIFGIVDVIEQPQRDVPGGKATVMKRWPHAVKIRRTPWYVENLENAPSMWDISRRIMSEEIHQGVSHVLMSPEEVERSRAALQKAKVAEGRP